jgi:hypothetical protein
MAQKERRYEEVAVALDNSANKAGVSYAIVGGFAISVWGRPRYSEDVDCLIKIPRESVEKFKQSLNDQHLQVDPLDVSDASNELVERLTIHDFDSSFRIDCKVAKTRSEIDQIQNSESVSIGTGSVKISRPEDIIAYKLKHGGSSTIEDVRSILRNQRGKLDDEYLDDLATGLGVSAQLQSIKKTIK